MLEAGLELPSERRPAALRSLETDADLVAEALALLDEEADFDTFLEIPAADALDSEARHRRWRGDDGHGCPETQTGGTAPGDQAEELPSPTDGESAQRPPPPPELLGFKVETLLGEGGMGRVYRARQISPGERTVAIKVMRPGLLHSAVAARFPVEQRALARLNHPAIAQFFSADHAPGGEPYVVMEYVDGEPITRYADHRRLDLEARLRLLISVCRGVEHAHQRQLLHRDLKPSNILVTTADGRPRPKIIDFGIARILDAPTAETDVARDGGSATNEGNEPLTGVHILGTPHYMSPEALQRLHGPQDLDTRTDVYSLGVVLHELLTGRRPDRPSLTLPREEATAASVTEAGPERPSTRVERMPREELRGIEQAREVESGKLSRRLNGDLDWIAIKALAPNREERYGSAAELATDLERYLRHEPVSARPPSLVYRVSKLARRHRLVTGLVLTTLLSLVAATIFITLALVRVTDAERRARAEAAAASQTLDFLVELFQSANPAETRGREVTAQEVVQRGAEEIEDQELPPLQRARLLHTLAQVQLNLRNLSSSRNLAREALSLRETTLPTDHPDLLASLDLLGTVERRVGNLAAAEPLMERALALAQINAEERPAQLGDALNSLGNLRWRQDRWDEAEALHRRALDIRRQLSEEDPERRTDYVGSLNNLGVLLWSQGDLEEAEPYLRQALEGFESELGQDHPRSVAALINLGNVLYNLDREAESEAILRRALELSERVLGPDHERTSATLHNLALPVASQGRSEEALSLYERALDIRQRKLGVNHTETLRTLANLANLHRREGRREVAIATLEEVIRRHRASPNPDPWRLARSLFHCATLHREVGNPETAETLLLEAEALQAQLDPPRPSDLARTLRERASLAAERQDTATARRLRQRADRLEPPEETPSTLGSAPSTTSR